MSLLDFTEVCLFNWGADFVPEENSMSRARLDGMSFYLCLMCCLTPSNMNLRCERLQCMQR